MMETVYFNFIFGAHTGKPGPETLEGPYKNRKTRTLPEPYKNRQTGTLARPYKNWKTGTLEGP